MGDVEWSFSKGKLHAVERGGGVALMPREKERRKQLPVIQHYAIPARKLGTGFFTKAYLETGVKNPHVYLFTREEGAYDFSKRMLSEIVRFEGRSPYLPHVVHVGWATTHTPGLRPPYGSQNYTVYRLPLYRAPLQKSDSAKAWRQYNVLAQCWKEGLRRAGYARRSGFLVMMAVTECARAKPTAPAGLVRALELLTNHARVYEGNHSFEFSPRNLATTRGGQLILLDTVYSITGVGIGRRAR
jgi:hypothetical protein